MKEFASEFESDPFDGIITKFNNLYKKSWNNFVKAKSEFTNYSPGRDECQSLIDRSVTGNEIKDEWCSKKMQNGSFILSFPKNRIFPASYTLQTGNQNSYPITWIVEASNDLESWAILSEENNEILKEKLKSSTFNFYKNESYKHFRFTQLYGNAGVESYFCLKKLEMFGFVINESKLTCRSKCARSNGFVIVLVLLIA